MMKWLAASIAVLLLAACGPEEDNNGTNNGTAGTNNETTPDTNGSTDNADTNNSSNGDDGPGTIGASCTLDPDCADGLVCDELVCAQPQTNNGSNGATNGDTNSQTNSATNGTNNETTSTNNQTNGSPLMVAQILDISSGLESCDVSDPGSDIFGVALEDDTGTVIGWGSYVSDDIQFAGNDFVDTTHLSGDPPALANDNCPDEFNADTVVALGCDGWVAVEFRDENGDPVALVADSGQAIRVYEYGGQCSTGSATDEYSLFLCTDPSAVEVGDASSCTVDLLAGASGEATALVSGF